MPAGPIECDSAVRLSRRLRGYKTPARFRRDTSHTSRPAPGTVIRDSVRDSGETSAFDPQAERGSETSADRPGSTDLAGRIHKIEWCRYMRLPRPSRYSGCN